MNIWFVWLTIISFASSQVNTDFLRIDLINRDNQRWNSILIEEVVTLRFDFIGEQIANLFYNFNRRVLMNKIINHQVGWVRPFIFTKAFLSDSSILTTVRKLASHTVHPTLMPDRVRSLDKTVRNNSSFRVLMAFIRAIWNLNFFPNLRMEIVSLYNNRSNISSKMSHWLVLAPF